MAAQAQTPLMFSGFSLAAGRRRDALDERVVRVHVEDEDAGAAELQVVADAGADDVEEVPLALLRRPAAT